MDTIPANDPMQNPPQIQLGGLDPANLLQQGVAEDTFMDGAANSKSRTMVSMRSPTGQAP
jgi:hypothetical protein